VGELALKSLGPDVRLHVGKKGLFGPPKKPQNLMMCSNLLNKLLKSSYNKNSVLGTKVLSPLTFFVDTSLLLFKTDSSRHQIPCFMIFLFLFETNFFGVV
jgi:hypothetical protein